MIGPRNDAYDEMTLPRTIAVDFAIRSSRVSRSRVAPRVTPSRPRGSTPIGGCATRPSLKALHIFNRLPNKAFFDRAMAICVPATRPCDGLPQS
jgi:hypothetical protein